MIISKTPFRLEFLGGSTDMEIFYKKYTGHVLNVTLDKYIYVYVRRLTDKKIRIITEESSDSIGEIAKIKNLIVKSVLDYLNIDFGLEIIISSDINSKGSGLGSSSSLVVGLVNAVSALKGNILSKENLAEIACELEIGILKSPIGKQDQYSAVYGGLSKYTFNRDGMVEVEDLGLDEKFISQLNRHLLVFSTGTSHSASNILNNQNQKFEENFEKLKAMGNLVVPACNLLSANDIESFAKVLETEWSIKKKLSNGISNEDIDKMYSKARRSGAWGGRLSGAGGGGYLYVFAPTLNHKKIITSLKEYKLFPVSFTKEGSKLFNF